MMPTSHHVNYNIGIKILLNNNFVQSNSHVFEHIFDSRFVNDSHLFSDPKAAIKSVGLDWDTEVARLNSPFVVPHNSITNANVQTPYGNITIASDPDMPFESWRIEYPKKKPECQHEWALYAGFMEAFEFCKKCDKRKGT